MIFKILKYPALLIAAAWTFNHINPWIGLVGGIIAIYYFIKEDLDL